MKRDLPLIAALLALASAAEAQISYCKDIGHNKTYCSGGTLIQREGRTTVISNVPPAQPHPAALPNPLLQNSALPTLNAPYSGAGTQNALPAALPAPANPPARPDAPGGPVIVVPPAGSRVCHQFGTTLVCN